MRSEILSQEKNVVVVKAEFDASEVDQAVAATVRDLSKRANIKGFRKGRVPRKTLEMYFGKSAILKEAHEDLAQKALDEAVQEYALDLVARPNVDMPELKEGEPLSITFTFEVRPEVKLPEISEIEAKKTVYKVTEHDIDHEIDNVFSANSTLEPIDDMRHATADDIVEAQYTSSRTSGGQKIVIEDQKKSVLNIPTLRKDIADALIGHEPAEEFSFEIKLEDDYPDKRLAGETITYEMEILHFMRRVVPEKNDESADRISGGRFKTMELLREEVKRQMEENAVERSEASLREAALLALAEASEVEVPDTMIDRQYQTMRNEQDLQVHRDLNQSLDEYLKSNNLSVSEFDENLRKRAAQTVRNTLVLDALADRDEISFTSDDMNEEIMRIAMMTRTNPQELADKISKDRDQFTTIAMRVRTNNTIKHLAGLVKVVEVEAEQEEHHHDHEGESR